MSTVFYKLHPDVVVRPVIAVKLSHDIEYTIFGDDGRDTTTKGLVGDYLILEQVEDDEWSVVATYTPEEMDQFYAPIGG